MANFPLTLTKMVYYSLIFKKLKLPRRLGGLGPHPSQNPPPPGDPLTSYGLVHQASPPQFSRALMLLTARSHTRILVL